MHVRLDRPHRALDDQLDADRRRQVEDDVALVDQLGDRGGVVHALDRVVEPGMPAQVADVVDAPGREIVEHEDLIAPLQVGVGQVRPDEPRPPRDEHPHPPTPPTSLTTPDRPDDRRRSGILRSNRSGL